MNHNPNIRQAELVTAFEPTPRHLTIRERLKNYAPPHLLARLGPDTIDSLRSVLPPYLVEEVKNTCITRPEFLEWLVSEDDASIMMLQNRTKAAKKLSDILDQDTTDPKMIALQLKASETILSHTKRERPAPQQTRNLNITALPGIPKQLANKTAEELEEELRKLSGG